MDGVGALRLICILWVQCCKSVTTLKPRSSKWEDRKASRNFLTILHKPG
ncbi:hypothetical protein T09_816 [Trichinella sp. T9]|nr:hypothetical protein T09_816 [Trichinella sp. T9]